MKPLITPDYTPEKRNPGVPLSNSREAKEFRSWIDENHERIERETGIPVGSLKVISGHESGFDPLAVSFSYAKGAFQFTTATARAFGLRVDDEVDERLDYQKATVAAAKYMKENMNRYGSFTESVVDYNSGPRGVKALRSKANLDQYDNGNKNIGELAQFIRGIKKKADEFGFTDLSKEISEKGLYFETPAVDQVAMEPVKKKDPIIENASTDQWIKNYHRRMAMFKARETVPSPVPLESVFKDDGSKTDYSYSDDFYKNIDQQYRAFKSGGSLLQLSEGNKIESVLMGSERIYSRGDTKRMMSLAKKANTKMDLFLLGKFVYDATKKQDSRPPEYVED